MKELQLRQAGMKTARERNAHDALNYVALLPGRYEKHALSSFWMLLPGKLRSDFY